LTTLVFFSYDEKIEQNKIDNSDKMNYFMESLKEIKQTDKLDILYTDSIKLYSKKPNFKFLIQIFIYVYNTNLCSSLLNEFNKNIEKPLQIDSIIENGLEKYNDYFDDICDKAEDLITSNSLDKIDFYGLILCYLNNYFTEKFNEQFKKLYKENKSILFEVILKYKSYFKKEINLGIDIQNEIIRFSSTKDFSVFKNSALFYLKDINTFLDIIEKNKEELIKIKNFEPIEVGQIENIERIDIEKVIEKMKSIIEFSKEKKILLINFKYNFWDSMAKNYSGISIKNIELCYRIREELKKYNSLINELFQKDNDIRKENNYFYKKGIFIGQLNKNIKSYIKNTSNITNLEIIKLIKNYDVYYSDSRYIKKREPEILEKIDLEKVDKNFIENFEKCEFEKIFKDDLKNYILKIANKIKKITDFEIIIKLINLNNLENEKSTYLNLLKSKYNMVIKSRELQDNNEIIVKSIANLINFICVNENKTDFMNEIIKKSNIIDLRMKHKIYLELIKFGNDKQHEKIYKFISEEYLYSIKLQNLNNFIEFLQSLNEEDYNNMIENLDEKYIIVESEFYSPGENLNIQLLNLLYKKFKLKEENKYIKKNIKVLYKIFKDIDEKEIKYEYLDSLLRDQKSLVLEKLNILNLLQDKDINSQDIYEDLNKYFNEMKNTLDKLSEYKKALELYYQEYKKKEISDLNKIYEEMKKGTYNYYYKKKAEIQPLFDEFKDYVEKVNDVKNLKIFRLFFQKNNMKKEPKDNDGSTPFDKAYSEFKKFKQSLTEKGPDIINSSNQDRIIKKLIEQNQEDNEIQKEILSLFHGQGKNDDEINLLFNSKIYENDLNSMFYFLSYFQKDKAEIINLKEKCQNFSGKKDIIEMKGILNELKERGIYDYTKESNNKNKSNYIKMFHSFFEKRQALDFLYYHNTEDIKILYDKIEPNNKTLQMKDISDTLNCVGFFQELKEKNDLKEILNYIKIKLDNKDLLIRFENYSEIYRSIIELNQNFDFSQNIYEEIEVILNDAKFIFNKNNDEFKYKKKNGSKDYDDEYENITIDKIRELKNKLQIKKERKQSSIDDNSIKFYEKYEKLRFFKDLCSKIEEICDLMNTLRIKGSTLPISIRIEISYPKVKYFLGKGNQNIEFKEIQNFLLNAKTNIIKKLDAVYKQMTTIRFIYGKQINSILSHIQGNYSIDSFLRYILNLTDCEKNVKEGKKAFSRKVNDYVNEYDLYNDNSFDIIHNYIISLFKGNDLTIEDHYKNISIKKDKCIKGIYKYLSKYISMEEDILQIFLDKIGKIPIAQNILVNNKETSYEEMQAFFNRAILCKYNTIFVVKVNNSFSNYQQRCMNIFIDKLLTFKNKIYNEKEEGREVDKKDTYTYMDSCIVFIYNKDSEQLLNELKNLEPKELPMEKTNHSLKRNGTFETLSSNSSIDPLRDALFVNTHIIRSDICGLGKSTKIRNEIKKSGKKYIYFPLGGNISKNSISKKLEKVMKNIKTENNFKDIAIHLDLFESKEHSILNEFLFSFLITKFYSNNENIIYIPINIEIYIEIPNCFNDFISNYEILKFFKRVDDNISIDDIPELNLSDDKIRLFKNMLGKDNNKEIYNWLKRNIKLRRYSYHQINIFINLFICQYNKFGGSKLRFYKKEKDVTKECIDSFAEGTKYFTYGGFSKLLLGERSRNDSKMDSIDLLSQEYDNDLKKDFNKKLIFIIKDKKIYYTLDISTEALKNGEALYKLNEEEKAERQKEIEKYSLEKVLKYEFLDILRKILDLKNQIESNENKSYSEKLSKIIDKDNYVITIDNFRKMILILYRIIANIPVILMGETGCGKTALIKKLNQLLNNGEETLVTLNIDPSYKEEKLLKKMNEINDKAKKKNKEVWVFFDEINTCDSLALITEIFINRTYNGIKLEDNIRLIGACNPYRKKKKNKNVCGLIYPNDDNQLVYIVNILPQSLFYYVFNFGSLEKENEDQYISSIISDIIINEKLKEKTKNVISKCHEYLRETFDPSVVSLRELARFKKIFRFFIEYFKNKNKWKIEENGNKESENLNFKKTISNKESENLKSIIISIYLCYYIRLVDGDTRSSFDSDLKEPFKELVNYNVIKNSSSEDLKEDNLIHNENLKNDLQNNYNITDLNDFNFSQILFEEEDFIIQKENIKLDKGIGKNKSLKENIFLLFTSLVTNIPLIIIGKPGSGKSLSTQLICKEMNGQYSRGKFFRLYPSIIQSYFQGSDSTTPEDVEGIFQIGEGRLKALKEKDENTNLPISMILFDELGLAERSKYNPLKALHSNLELDGNRKGISFVGISNWVLDAAKINRALFLSVPDLDDNLDDLKYTSNSIAQSINEDFEKQIIFSKILPNVYFKYKNILKSLKKLTVYKKYELQEYKRILNKYKEDETLKRILENYKEFNNFFEKDQNIKEEEIKMVYEYDAFKKVKNKLDEFLKIKTGNTVFDRLDFDNDEFKKLLENDRIINIDFHGNRDFYYLVKGIANEMNENNGDLKKIIKKYIERNFGGLEYIINFETNLESMELIKKDEDIFTLLSKREKLSSVQLFKIIYNFYCEKNETDYMIEEADIDDYNYIKNIIDNIKDVNSRYLLLEIKPSLASLIHQKIKKEIKKKKIYFYEGSPFVNDNSNEYQFKIINQIQEHAENGDFLILHNLNQVYAFLYDLFNKNFIIKDGKKYARICHGNFSDQLTHINEEFKIIIMVNKKFLDKVDPPFLNRFEKMIISFDKLISKKEKDLADIILGEIDLKKCINRLNYKINYELKDLLIGCQKEDILGMIYYELNSNESNDTKEGEKKDEIIKNKIFNKIYKLLPQDIIVNLDEENNLRSLYYSNELYYNLEHYLSTEPNFKISIIYTFYSITEVINGIDESSSFKMISEIKSEIQLNSIINTMISEYKNNKTKNKNKQNLIFIHFDETNSKKIGFLISFVINNYSNNRELKFIFIVHIKRNFLLHQNKEKKLDKIYAVPDINPDINQLFIDNLNGPKIKLNDILSDPIQKLLDENLLNLEEEFKKKLRQFTNENLKVLYGENKNINKDNYSEKLEKYFENNRNFMNNIIKKISTYINEKKENPNNIIENIYKSQYVNKSSIDIISVIIDFVRNEIILKYINIILCKLESNNILTTLLVLKSDQELIDDEIVDEMNEKYLDSIKIEDNKYKPKFILSYVIPGFYDFYAKLSDFITQNIKNDFIKNEKNIRNFLKGDKFKTKEKYHKIEEDLLSLTYRELENYEFILEFINKIPSDIILKDYITYYLIKYNSDGDMENILNYYHLSYNDYYHLLINLLLKIRFNEEKAIVKNNKNNSLKLLLMKINWIEANKDYIIKILKIYDFLKNNFEENEFYSIIENTLKMEKLRYITNEKKNPDITTEVNECYYKLLASICYSIIPPNIDFKNAIETYEYLDSLKNAMKIVRSLNDDLHIYSIEIDLIDELIEIYDILELNNKLDNNSLNEICQSLKKNNEILISNKEIKSDELIEEFKILYELIKKSLNYTDKKYFDLLKFICFKEIKKVPNVKYRTAIFQNVIKDNEIIIKSNDILQILLFPLVNPNKIKFPKSIIEILNSTDYDIASIIENILENENEDIQIVLSETLLYYFEKNSLMYFNNIFHAKEKILFENDEENPNYGPLKLFKECIQMLNSYKKKSKNLEGKNKNICKLFCIGYIRAYCYTFINLMDSCSPKLVKPIKIISEVNNAKSLKKIISFYIWKIIYYKNKKNIDMFIDPESKKKYKLDDYEFFKNKKNEIENNPFTYNYIDPKGKDNYNKFNEILEKYKDNKFENVKIEDFDKNKIDIDLFYFSTSNLILSRLKQRQFLDSPIYNNFYKNVCIPLFKTKDKIHNAIKLLYDPQKFKKLKTDLGITPDNLNIILYSYRYFLNELNANHQDSVFSAFYSKYINIKKINNHFYPGNDIRNIQIYSIFSQVENHFKETPNQGCFVCLCNKGGYYHSVKGGVPGSKYLNLKCKSCNKEIGAFKNERGYIQPIKRENYYRILKTKEESDIEAKRNFGNYNCMSLDELKKNYIIKEYEKEKGISRSDEYFFLKDTKTIRNLSQISFRILNFILYSHIMFSKFYNNFEELKIYLPKNMTWIQVISECWKMIKNELSKIGISAIDIFMNYIFSDLFTSLSEQKSLNEFNELINFEKKLDEKIQKKIQDFKNDYKNFDVLKEFDSQDKFFFQNILDERYKINEVNDKDDYPFYNYFYYSEYINEDYLLDKLNHSERNRYPVLLKVLENKCLNRNKIPYSLDNLPIFNEVLNLFNEKYSYAINREKANKLQLKDIKDEEIYNENRSLIHDFISFYNNLKIKNENNIIMELSEKSKLSDFFVDDNNDFGKSYKYIYNKFINEQNREILDLLDIKIGRGIFESDCKNKINIQSANKDEIFITNLPEKFSFIEVVFNCSYRKFSITNDYSSYKQIELNLDSIEDRMTELLLRNKKLFDDSISNFVYANEKLEFENKDIITTFNSEYDIEKINIEDQKILYKFYEENKENINLFKVIFNDFIQFKNKTKIKLDIQQ